MGVMGEVESKVDHACIWGGLRSRATYYLERDAIVDAQHVLSSDDNLLRASHVIISLPKMIAYRIRFFDTAYNRNMSKSQANLA